MNTRVFRIKSEIESETYDEAGGLEKALTKILDAVESFEVDEIQTPVGAAV